MQNTKRFVNSRVSGFSLLEVLVAVAIFSIGILAIGGLQYIVIDGNASANVVTQQVMLAQRVLEELKNVPDPTDLSNFTLDNVDMNGEGSGPYDVDTRISNPLGHDVSRFISVTVTKEGPHGHPITVNTMTHGNGI